MGAHKTQILQIITHGLPVIHLNEQQGGGVCQQAAAAFKDQVLRPLHIDLDKGGGRPANIPAKAVQIDGRAQVWVAGGVRGGE